MASKLLTVLLTDLKGFTQRTAEGSREDLIALVRRSEELTFPLIRRFGGQVVKTIGDAVLATFESPTNALHCSILILEDIAACNRSQPPEQQIGMRIALSVGEVELLDGDIFGEAVNLCARLESVTGVDEIRFSEAVYQTMKKTEVPVAEVGRCEFKGIPQPVMVYRVERDPGSIAYQSLITRLRALPSQEPPKPRLSRGAIVTVGVAFLLLVISCWGRYGGPYILASKSEEALAAGNFQEALQFADILIRDFPLDERAGPLLQRIVTLEVEQLLRVQRPDKAADLLKRRLERYSMLTGEDLERRILQARVDQARMAGRSEEERQLRRQLEPHPGGGAASAAAAQPSAPPPESATEAAPTR